MNLALLVALLGCPAKDRPPTREKSVGLTNSGLECEEKIINVDIGTTEIRNSSISGDAVGLIYARCNKSEYQEAGCLIRSGSTGPVLNEVHPHPDADGSSSSPNALFMVGVRESWMGCSASECTWSQVEAQCQAWADAEVPGRQVVSFQLQPWDGSMGPSLKKMKVTPKMGEELEFWYSTPSEALAGHHMAWCLPPGSVGHTEVMPPSVSVQLSEQAGSSSADDLTCAGNSLATAVLTYAVVEPTPATP